MVKIMVLMAGGAAGTLLRYLVSGVTFKLSCSDFPWGTLVVNLAGAFLIGLLWGSFRSDMWGQGTKLFVFTGLLGGFTTFSTYALDTVELVKNHDYRNAIWYVIASNLGGIILAAAGYLLIRFTFAPKG